MSLNLQKSFSKFARCLTNNAIPLIVIAAIFVTLSAFIAIVYAVNTDSSKVYTSSSAKTIDTTSHVSVDTTIKKKCTGNNTGRTVPLTIVTSASIDQQNSNSQNSDDISNNSTNKWEKIQTVIWLFSSAFITLIVAIVAWVGVTDTLKIMEIVKNLEKKEKDLLQTASKVDFQIRDYSTNIELKLTQEISKAKNDLDELVDQYQGSLNALSRSNRTHYNQLKTLRAFVQVQQGFSLRRRFAAALFLKQDDSIGEQWQYFVPIWEREKVLFEAEKDSLPHGERVDRGSLLRHLEWLASPPDQKSKYEFEELEKPDL